MLVPVVPLRSRVKIDRTFLKLRPRDVTELEDGVSKLRPSVWLTELFDRRGLVARVDLLVVVPEMLGRPCSAAASKLRRRGGGEL